MGFGQAISSVFSKYVTFSGRARRSEYWYFFLFSFLAGMAAGIVDAIVFRAAAPFQPISTLLSLAVLLPSLSVTVRRMHDTGWSGWWLGGFYLYFFVAIVIIGASYGAYMEHAMTSAVFGLVCLILGLVAIAGAVWLFILMLIDGHRGPNQFGPDPKGPDAEVFS